MSNTFAEYRTAKSRGRFDRSGRAQFIEAIRDNIPNKTDRPNEATKYPNATSHIGKAVDRINDHIDPNLECLFINIESRGVVSERVAGANPEIGRLSTIGLDAFDETGSSWRVAFH